MQVPDEEQSSQPLEDARERQDRSKLRRSGIPARFRRTEGASSSSSGLISADIHNAAEGHMVISPIHRSWLTFKLLRIVKSISIASLLPSGADSIFWVKHISF